MAIAGVLCSWNQRKRNVESWPRNRTYHYNIIRGGFRTLPRTVTGSWDKQRRARDIYISADVMVSRDTETIRPVLCVRPIVRYEPDSRYSCRRFHASVKIHSAAPEEGFPSWKEEGNVFWSVTRHVYGGYASYKLTTASGIPSFSLLLTLGPSCTHVQGELYNKTKERSSLPILNLSNFREKSIKRSLG